MEWHELAALGKMPAIELVRHYPPSVVQWLCAALQDAPSAETDPAALAEHLRSRLTPEIAAFLKLDQQRIA